jgi:very-short-patch-repair endonuclease
MSIERARRLRKNLTDAERRLWSKLRRRQLDGFRFRRQAPLGIYFVDFLCLEERLIIEVDGGQHAIEQAADGKRTTWLDGEGFRVLRFWNNDVLANTDGVIETILRALRG